MQYCPHCGERVDAEDAYCFECGTALDAPSGEAGSDRRERGVGTRRGDTQDTRPHSPSDGRNQRARGRTPGDPGDGPGAPGRYGSPGGTSSGRVESLGTLWVAAALSVVSLIESAAIVLFADELLELVQEEGVGFAEGVSANAIALQGGIGLLIGVAALGVCVHYYRQGYVDRRFFWILVATGVAGFFLGGGLTVAALTIVGGYGLLVVLRRDRS